MEYILALDTAYKMAIVGLVVYAIVRLLGTTVIALATTFGGIVGYWVSMVVMYIALMFCWCSWIWALVKFAISMF